LQTIAIQGARDVQNEASRQGFHVELPDLGQISEMQVARAAAIDQALANALSVSAQNNALRLASGVKAKLSMQQLADKVKARLAQMSDSYLNDQLGGALTAAMNSGRRATLQGDSTPKTIYASEILDNNTCAPCAAEDGTIFYSLDDAETDYPSGGFVECAGGPRCRGTLIAVYGESETTLE